MQKILIVEAGGTKSQIAEIIGDNVNEFTMGGLNPNMHDELYISDYFLALSKKVTEQADEIHFYGAGTSTKKSQDILQRAANKFFGKDMNIESDMMAVCRAGYGNQSGHAAILGTGANCCYYDGQQIIEKRSGFGIILGDEGSGAYLGKLFIQDYLNDLLPKEIQVLVNSELDLSKEKVIEATYLGDSASKWLGQFTLFIAKNRKEVYFKKLIDKNFELFFSQVIRPFKHPVKSIIINGGFAEAFKIELTNFCKKESLHVQDIIGASLPGLIAYHQSR